MGEDELLNALLRRIEDENKKPVLPVRARKALPKRNILFWGDILGLSRGYFFSVPGVGDKTVREIDDILMQFGLFRGMYVDPLVTEKFRKEKYKILQADFRR